MDNVISGLLPNLLMSGRRLQRSYTVGPAGSASVQVVSAMLVQMLQVSRVHTYLVDASSGSYCKGSDVSCLSQEKRDSPGVDVP